MDPPKGTDAPICQDGRSGRHAGVSLAITAPSLKRIETAICVSVRPKGAQDMRRPGDAGRAGGIGGRGEPWLHGAEHVLRVETIESDIGIVPGWRRSPTAPLTATDVRSRCRLATKTSRCPRDSRAFLPGVATGHELVGGAHAHRRDLCHHTGVASASRLLIGLYAPAARPR